MTSARTKVAVSLGLFVLTLIAYGRLWTNDFIDLDDEKYVTANVHVRDGLTAENVSWAWNNYDVGLWIPLVWMSLQIDWSLSHYFGSSTGLKPSIYHLHNLVWHFGTTLLLFLTLYRMTAKFWPSAFVAALFAVHPLHVESVAWATERKDVLSAFFWMFTVLAYVRYVEHTSFIRYVLVLLAFVLGLLAKPILVTLPCALLLLDYWPLHRCFRLGIPGIDVASGTRFRLWKIVLEKVPLFVLAITVSMVAIQGEQHDQSVVTLADVSIPSRLANAVTSYAWYLEKTFWPSNLCVFYIHPMNDWTWPPVLVSVTVIAAISTVALATARRAPWFIVGWLWFLGTLAPVIGFIQVGLQARADRFVYIPHVGLFIAIVWSAVAILNRWKVGLVARVTLWTGCVLVLTVLTFQQVGYWKNRQTIWTHAAVATSDNHRAHSRLGTFFLEKFQATGNRDYLDQAFEQFRETVRIKPGDPDYENNYGAVLLYRGDLEEAGTHFRETLRSWPNHFTALQNLGMTQYLLKNYREAERVLRRTLEFYPEAFETRAHLGQVLWDLGQHDAAKEQWEAALAIKADCVEAQEGMGQFYLLQGDNDAAARNLQAVVRMKPEQYLTWSQLGLAEGRLKRWDDSIPAHENAVKIAAGTFGPGPELALYIRRLAFALNSAGRTGEAQILYVECLKMDFKWTSTNLETAWKLATSAEIKPGDAATAYELASEVIQATETPDSRMFDVQAATLAAIGRFDDAVLACRKGLQLAAPDQVSPIQERLALYEKKKRYVRK